MKRIYVLVVTLIVAGCFPVIETIYRPDALGGRILETTCNYNQGPGRWNKIELIHGEVRLQVQTFEVQQKVKLGITFIVPEGNTVQITSSSFNLISDGRTKTVDFGDMLFTDQDSKKTDYIHQNSTISMTGKTYQSRWQKNGKKYNFSINLVDAAFHKAFAVELPIVHINGKSVSFPRINFLPTTAAYFSGYC